MKGIVSCREVILIHTCHISKKPRCHLIHPLLLQYEYSYSTGMQVLQYSTRTVPYCSDCDSASTGTVPYEYLGTVPGVILLVLYFLLHWVNRKRKRTVLVPAGCIHCPLTWSVTLSSQPVSCKHGGDHVSFPLLWKMVAHWELTHMRF